MHNVVWSKRNTHSAGSACKLWRRARTWTGILAGAVADLWVKGGQRGPCRCVKKLARRHFSGGNSVEFFAGGPYGAPHHPPPPLSPPFLKGGGGDGGAGGVPTTPAQTPPHLPFFGAMQQNAKSLWPTGGQFARVVKGVDLRSTAGNCAWVRTPQLASLSVVGFLGVSGWRCCV